jgi:hypothetical protein
MNRWRPNGVADRERWAARAAQNQSLDLRQVCRLCDVRPATEEGLYCGRCYAWQLGDSPPWIDGSIPEFYQEESE